MTDLLVFSASFTGIALLLSLFARAVDRRLAFAFGLAFALYLGLDDLATAFGPRFDFVGGAWNWSGKVASLVLSAAVIVAFRMHPEAVGLRLPRRAIGASLLATALLLAASVALALLFRPEAPTMETLAFQATMPGLAEELAYRGIAPALLLGLVGGKAAPRETPWVVVTATALMFGIWHGLGYADGAFGFQWIPAAYTFVGGVVYGWMRFNNGSLLFPVLAHCLGNAAFQLVPLVQG